MSFNYFLWVCMVQWLFYGGHVYLKCALGTRLHCVWLLEVVLMKDMRLIQIQVYIVSLVPYVLELCNLKD